MDIPEKIGLRNTMHGSGARGMAVYGYEDTAGLGLRMEVRREDGRSPFVETWFLDALPGREFPTFAALRDAALPLTSADVAAVEARYPVIGSVEPDPCGNRCRLCPRPPFVPGQEPAKHETWRVMLSYSWCDEHGLSLCAEHLEQYRGDAKALRDAIEAEASARIARAASKDEALRAPQEQA